MPDLPISGLPSVANPTAADLLPIVQAGVTSHITPPALFGLGLSADLVVYSGTGLLSDSGVTLAMLPRLAAANSYTVSPQTITSDTDAHVGLILRGHSGTQSADLVDVYPDGTHLGASVTAAGRLRLWDKTGVDSGYVEVYHTPSADSFVSTQTGRLILQWGSGGTAIIQDKDGNDAVQIDYRGLNVTEHDMYVWWDTAGIGWYASGIVQVTTGPNTTLGQLAVAGLRVATTANGRMGTATLAAGTVTVATTAVTAASKIFLTDAGGGVLANIGSLSVGTVTAGTSFVANSSNVLDTSNVNWLIIEPA